MKKIAETLASNQQKAEELLIERERQLATLMNNLPGMAYRCKNDQNWTMEFISDGVKALTGYTASELVGNKKVAYADLIHPADRDALLEQVQVSLKRKKPFILNYRLRKATGEECWVWEQGQGVFDSQHQLIALEGFVVDITERKRTEEALVESEAKYKTMVTQSPDGIFIIDLSGKFLSVNKTMCDNLKYTEEEFLSMKIWDIVPEQFQSLHKQRLLAIIKGESLNSNAEYDVKGKDGILHTIEVRSAPFYKGNELIGFQGIAHDITDQKNAEKVLRESEEKYRNIFENIQDVYFETTIDGIILEISPSIRSISKNRYTREDLIGRSIYDFYANALERQTLVSALKDQGSVSAFEIVLKNPDGPQISCSVSSKLIFDAQGHPNKIIGSINDITERKRSEQVTAALYNISKAVSTSNTLQSLFIIIHETLDSIIIAKNFYIALIDDANKNIVFQYEVDENPSDSSTIISLDDSQSLTVEIIHSKKPLLLNEEELNKRYEGGKNRIWRTRAKCWMGVPLLHGEEVIGAMAVQSYDKSSIYTDKDVALFSAVGQQVAIAIQHKRAEDELAKSELRFRELYQNAKIGLYRTTPRGTIIMANNELVKMLGYSSFEKLAERNLEGDGFEPSYQRKEFIEKIEKDGEIKDFESAWIRQDGNVLFVRESTHVIRDSQGKTLYYEGVVEDITERKQAEKNLIASETRYRRLFESAKDGILILDAETGRIMDVNPFLVEILGYSHKQFTEKAIWEIGFFKDIITNQDKFLELQQQEYVRYDNLPLETASGRKINVEFVSNVYLVDKKKVIQCNIRDITERKRVENALITSKTHLRMLVQNIPDLIWTKDIDGIYLSCNAMFERFFGASEADIIGKTDYDFVNRELADFFRENDRKAMGAGKPTSNEEWITFANDGHRAYLETIKAPMFDDQNRLIGVLGIGRDITERKSFVDELKEKNTFIQTVLDKFPIGIALNKIDNGNAFYVNKKFEEIYGWPKDEMNDIASFFEKVYPDKKYREELAIRVNKDIQSGDASRMHWEDCVITHIDGSTHIINAVNIPLFDQNTMVSTVVDVTERKRAEKEITMLAHSLRSVNECVSITDLDDKILFVNESFLKTYGYELNELIGKHISIVGSHNDVQELVKKISQATIHGEWQGELLNRKKDGSEFPIYLSTTIIKDKESNTLGLIGVATDITDHKRAEKELINAKEKAEENDKLKTAFLQNMSHEIRTPMNGILGFAGLLKKPNLTGEKQQEYIEIIENSGARMLNIINDIIDISKIETEHIELNLQEINVNQLIRNMYVFFQVEAEKTGLNLTYKTGLSDDRCIIETDETKLTQVLSNLLKNAFKFTKSGTIDFGYHRKDELLEFYVKDTGIGITPELQNIIFERFRQVDMSATRDYEGAGLGLSISKAFVEKFGGKIWVKSELGKGSTFLFNIPYKTKIFKLVETSSEIRIKDRLKNVNILIAEDDYFSMQLLKEMLESENANLFFAKNGQEALDILETAPEIQIVLMDLKMPVMNGFEAIQLIKKMNPGLPIIAQSAYAFSDDQEKAKIAGCDEVISKPINLELLLSMISKQLERVK